MILRARSTVSRPSGVRTTLRFVLSTSVASSTFSSSLMLALKVDHAAGLGSAAEMAMVGERDQMAEMPYGGQVLHAIAPNRSEGCRVAGIPPEVHAAECEDGHKLGVMAVTKRRFWSDAPNSLPPCANLGRGIQPPGRRLQLRVLTRRSKPHRYSITSARASGIVAAKRLGRTEIDHQLEFRAPSGRAAGAEMTAS